MLFICNVNYAQSTIFSDSVKLYFLNSLNEHRKNLYGDSIVILIINDNASLACKHHNEYLFNMSWVNKMPNQKKVFISHHEVQKDIQKDKDGNVTIFEYTGKNQLISNFTDRVRYYNTNNDFVPLGEVINIEGTRPSNSIQAEKILKGFLDSPAHKEILENPDCEFIAIDIKIEGPFISAVIITGTNPDNGLTFLGH